MNAAELEPVMEAFAARCWGKGIVLDVWLGKPSAMLGADAVCYNGNLSDCEKAERWVIPALQREYNDCRFCYCWPSSGKARSTASAPPADEPIIRS